MGQRRLLLLVLSLVFVLLAGAAVTAQLGPAASCPELVTRALEAVNTLCTGQDRNSACYGNTLVEADFDSAAGDVSFSQEGDIASLSFLRAIRTSPLNNELTEWGVSLLNVQANLPGALPGQNALFMLLGGAEIESAVEPETEFTPAQPVPVVTSAAATVLDAPQEGAAAVFAVDAGQAVLADAVSGDGAFVRVTLGEQYGWIARAALPADASLDALPPYTPSQSFAPMQAFYLRTGIGGAQCAQAPSALVVQGPENYEVNINANGADISLGSSIILETIPVDELKGADGKYAQPGVGGLLRITVIDGHATITSGGGSTTEIPEGYQSSICLTDNQNLGVDGQANDQTITYLCGGWTAPEEIPPEFREQFSLVDDFPLNYLFDVITPTPSPTAAELLPPAPTATPTATLEPTAAPPTAVPPTAIPPTAITGADLVFDFDISVDQAGGQGPVRFLGIGGGLQWFLDFAVTVTNNGPETATNLVLSDFYPEGMDGSIYTEDGFIDEGGAWVIGDLAAGQTVTAWGMAAFTLACGGSVTHTITVSSDTPDPFPAGTTWSATADCNGLVLDSTATLTWSGGGWGFVPPRLLGIGWLQAYAWDFDLSLTVTNNSGVVAENVVVYDVFSDSLYSPWSPTPGYDNQSDSWTVGTLDPGDSATLTGFSYEFLDCGTSITGYPYPQSDTVDGFAGFYEAVANCGAPDQLNINASASLLPGGEAMLAPHFMGAGWFQTETWLFDMRVTVQNDSTVDATNVVVTNIFPAEVPGGWSEAQGFDQESNSWTIGELAAGESATLYGAGYAYLECDALIGSTVNVNSDNVTGSSTYYSATAVCGPPATPFVEPPEATAEPLPEATIEPQPEVTAEVTGPEATLEVTEEAPSFEATLETTAEATEPPA